MYSCVLARWLVITGQEGIRIENFFFDAFFFVIDRNLKQGVCDVLQFFDQNVGSHDTTDIGLQKLVSFLKASSQTHK